MEKIKNYVIKIYNIIQTKEMKVLPGHLAFFIVLTIMPIVTLVAFICSLFKVSLGDMFGFIFTLMPVKVSELILPALNSSSSHYSILFMIIGFIIASNGAHSIILVSNALYGFKDRGFLSRHIKAILMTIMLIFIFLISLIGVAFGDVILKFILEMNIFSNVGFDFYHYFTLIKYPVAFILIYYFIRSMYSMAPDTKILSRSVIPGALFTTVCWLVVTSFYSYYANNVANFDLFYGGISNIIILMMWIYVISYIFVIGIAINSTQANEKYLVTKKKVSK